jgi:hypothetical protein
MKNSKRLTRSKTTQDKRKEKRETTALHTSAHLPGYQLDQSGCLRPAETRMQAT